MGVKGLWAYLDNHHVRYQLPDAGSSNSSGWAKVMEPDYLFLDMNCVLHHIYSTTTQTTGAFYATMVRYVDTLLSRVSPRDTIAFVFDGLAPLSKLPAQKDRRKGLPPTVKYPSRKRFTAESSYTGDLIGTEELFQKGEITSGSELVFAAEEVLRRHLDGLEKKTWKRCIISDSSVDGEGEVKISGILQQLYQEAVESGDYTGEESVVFVSADSDLLLVGMLATPYTHIVLLDPEDYGVAMIEELFHHWSSALPNPPLPRELLASYRIDFTFLFLLSGCDFYDGLRDQALRLWRRYRDLRANGGFFRSRLIEEGFTINVELLRQLTKHDGAHHHQLSRVFQE